MSGSVESQSSFTETVTIEYSWDGVRWQKGFTETVPARGQKSFTLTLRPPGGTPPPLRVRIAPGALGWADDLGDNAGTLTVAPCQVTCDLTVRIGQLPPDLGRGSTRVLVTAVKAGCPEVGPVVVRFTAGSRQEEQSAVFDPSRPDQARELTFYAGRLPPGGDGDAHGGHRPGRAGAGGAGGQQHRPGGGVGAGAGGDGVPGPG